MKSALLLSFAPVLVLAIHTGQLGGQPPLPPAPVAATAVVSREVAPTQSFVGTVRPARQATIGSAVDGRVVEFLVNEGERVVSAQPLARLLTSTITLQLATAKAELELREHELAELENGTRPEEKARAQAEMLSAKARKEYFRARSERADALFRNGAAASAEERDEALSAAIAAEQTYEKAVAEYDLAVAGPRQEQINQAQARVAMQQAMVEMLQDQINKHTIISRFDGYVTAERTEVGQWVKQGDPVVSVAALDEVEIVAHVVEQQIPFVKLGGAIEVEVPSLGRSFSGTVFSIVPQADVRARTFPVIVRVKNLVEANNPLLKSGMLARVNLPTGASEQALLVPKDALVLGGPQPALYMITPDPSNTSQGTVQPVSVEIGVASGQLIAVTGPLQAGQLVVVLGNERLRPGQRVAFKLTEPRTDKIPRAHATS